MTPPGKRCPLRDASKGLFSASPSNTCTTSSASSVSMYVKLSSMGVLSGLCKVRSWRRPLVYAPLRVAATLPQSRVEMGGASNTPAENTELLESLGGAPLLPLCTQQDTPGSRVERVGMGGRTTTCKALHLHFIQVQHWRFDTYERNHARGHDTVVGGEPKGERWDIKQQDSAIVGAA